MVKASPIGRVLSRHNAEKSTILLCRLPIFSAACPVRCRSASAVPAGSTACFKRGSACFLAVCLARLFLFTRKLNYHVLCTQPLVSEDRSGLFTDAQKVLERLVH